VEGLKVDRYAPGGHGLNEVMRSGLMFFFCRVVGDWEIFGLVGRDG